jgi:tetratricopeptide (TPR) repeat protein
MSGSRLEALKKFLEQDPADAFTRYAIALEYASLNNYPEAIAGMEELIVLDPNYVPAYHQLGNFYKHIGNINEALKILEKGIEHAAQTGDRHAQSEMQELVDELEE